MRAMESERIGLVEQFQFAAFVNLNLISFCLQSIGSTDFKAEKIKSLLILCESLIISARMITFSWCYLLPFFGMLWNWTQRRVASSAWSLDQLVCQSSVFLVYLLNVKCFMRFLVWVTLQTLIERFSRYYVIKHLVFSLMPVLTLDYLCGSLWLKNFKFWSFNLSDDQLTEDSNDSLSETSCCLSDRLYGFCEAGKSSSVAR